jgi:hypothetical protein
MRFTKKNCINSAIGLFIGALFHYPMATDIQYLPIPGKVAFIGNNLTMNNYGSDNVVKRLGDAMTPPLQLFLYVYNCRSNNTITIV